MQNRVSQFTVSPVWAGPQFWLQLHWWNTGWMQDQQSHSFVIEGVEPSMLFSYPTCRAIVNNEVQGGSVVSLRI